MLASFCGTCGLQFQPNETFCARCGIARDANVSDPTALLVSALNAPTVLNSNLQTICLNCGQPRSANVFPCPFCNSSVPTIQTQGMPIAQQLATDVPTPPLIVKDPTLQQIHAAMVGTVNPYGYGLWGDLVVDGSKKNVWDFPSNVRGFPSIARKLVQNVGLVTRLGSNKVLHVMPDINCQDFTYQIAMSFGYGIHGGMAFRVDKTQDECYVFSRKEPEHGTKDQLLVQICDTDNLRAKEQLLGTSIKFTERTALLAVVAQGTMLDFYVDLKHVKRLETRFVTSGSIGICIMGHRGSETTTLEVRNAKLWVKTP